MTTIEESSPDVLRCMIHTLVFLLDCETIVIKTKTVFNDYKDEKFWALVNKSVKNHYQNSHS